MAALRIYRALVISIDDPEGQGRIKLRTTRTSKGLTTDFEGWATAAAGFAATAPRYDVGDQVLYAAERLPFVGATVVCRSSPAQVRKPQPLSLTFDMGSGSTASLEVAAGTVAVRTSAGQSVVLQADGSVAVESPGTVRVSAGATVLTTTMLTVDSGMSKFSGVVRCDTLIANSVVAATYTPGAGNIA